MGDARSPLSVGWKVTEPEDGYNWGFGLMGDMFALGCRPGCVGRAGRCGDMSRRCEDSRRGWPSIVITLILGVWNLKRLHLLMSDFLFSGVGNLKYLENQDFERFAILEAFLTVRNLRNNKFCANFLTWEMMGGLTVLARAYLNDI